MKYHIFSISATVTPSPTKTQAFYNAELILREGDVSGPDLETKTVGTGFKTLEEAMACAEKECDGIAETVLQYAVACLDRFPDV